MVMDVFEMDALAIKGLMLGSNIIVKKLMSDMYSTESFLEI